MTVRPPKGVRSAGNLAGRVGRSLRNGHESFHFVRNGSESFLGSTGTKTTRTWMSGHTSTASSTWEYCKDEGRVGGQFAPHGGGREEVVGVCLVPVGKWAVS